MLEADIEACFDNIDHAALMGRVRHRIKDKRVLDRVSVTRIKAGIGVEAFLMDVRDQLRSRTFQPVPVRQVIIPKKSGKLRGLGIPTITDRVVQAALKLVMAEMPDRTPGCTDRQTGQPASGSLGGDAERSGLVSVGLWSSGPRGGVRERWDRCPAICVLRQ